MMRMLCAICFVFFLFACKKNNDSSSGELNGLYRGTFNRTGMDTAQVNIIFKTGNLFEGTGGPLNYPSICGGSFQRSGNTLAVNDTCTWTANFDWTLIFDGSYNINFTGGNSVRIWRTNGAVTDEYLLNKITR